MSDAPLSGTSLGSPLAPVGANMVSAFQTDSTILLAERFVGFELIRTSGVAALDASAWPLSGSPLV